MKFKDYTDIKTDQYGFSFIKNGIMIGIDEKPCLTCGCPSKYIEVCSEGHVCSDECVSDFYRQVDKMTEIDSEFEMI